MRKNDFRRFASLVMSMLMLISVFTPVQYSFAETADQEGQTVAGQSEDAVQDEQETVAAEPEVEADVQSDQEADMPAEASEDQIATETDEQNGADDPETAEADEPEAAVPAEDEQIEDVSQDEEGTELSAELKDIQLKIKAEPLNPSTKVYKNGRVGKFKVIFRAAWLKAEADAQPADGQAQTGDKAADGQAQAEGDAEQDAVAEEAAEAEGKAVYDELVADGWSFKFDLADKDGNMIAEDFDPEEGYKLVIPKKNKGFKVIATASKEGEQPQTFESEVTDKIYWVGVPTKVKAESDKDGNDVKVTWSKVEGASGYYVYRISSKKKIPKVPVKYVPSVFGRKYVDENLPGKKYYYYIQGVYLGDIAGASYHTSSGLTTKPATVKVEKFLTCKIRPISWHARIKSTASLFVNKTGGATKGSVKAGAKVVVTDKHPSKIPLGAHPSRVKIEYKGKTGWVGWGHLKGGVFGTVSYKNKKAYDWTARKKEQYVNNKEYDSPTKYLIWVSQYTQRVNVFKGSKGKWKLIMASRCVSGRFIQPTKMGSHFKIWKHQMVRTRHFYQSTATYYYTHLSYFSKGNSFHTICWRTGTKSVVNNIKGNCQPGTRGCIRMPVKNAIWIYKNIPFKTRVIVY